MGTQKFANPAPLGLLGFGLTTVLLNLHNAGLFQLDTMILSMGLAYGGLAQIITGLMEFRRGNTFGTVVFTSYGLFWWSLIMLTLLPQTTIFAGLQSPSPISMGAYFLLWGIFTLAMGYGTLKASKTLQIVFATTIILFFMLSITSFTDNPILFGNFTLTNLTGIEGVICGSSAIYYAIALVLNEVHEKIILPTDPLE
ncbi:MAG: acetate uptake transporter [Candidatus Bathyarchaeia archaeon]|jgi:succinate-acetate transporter protein